MSEICIISGTNRKESKTFEIAKIYQHVLKDKNMESRIFSLTELPENFAFADMFNTKSPAFNKIIETYLVKHDKFVFVVPEYNGSFPGVLKTFLDAVHPRYWTEKKAALVGVSEGRAGNLRGMEHLTAILHYLKMHVYHFKVSVPRINRILEDKDPQLTEDMLNVFSRQADGIIRF